jgi:hypothetical protein
MAAHGVVGGVKSAAEGGDFWKGFIATAATKASSIYGPEFNNFSADTARAAVVGGTVSAMTGDKFVNGAVLGAFSYAFNDYLHRERPSSLTMPALGSSAVDQLPGSPTLCDTCSLSAEIPMPGTYGQVPAGGIDMSLPAPTATTFSQDYNSSDFGRSWVGRNLVGPFVNGTAGFTGDSAGGLPPVTNTPDRSIGGPGTAMPQGRPIPLLEDHNHGLSPGIIKTWTFP